MQTTFTTFTCTTKFVPLISFDKIPEKLQLPPPSEEEVFIEGYGYVPKEKLGTT